VAALSGTFLVILKGAYKNIDGRLDAMEKNYDMFSHQVNATMTHFNSTVEKVQTDVEHQVKEVNDNVSSQNSLMAYQFAGTFAILGSLISFWHMTSHVRKLNEPIVQRKIIAIMWMIPIYSVTSWLGLVFTQTYGFLSLIKDIYEAYVIYTFLSLLIAILGRGNRDSVIELLIKHSDHLKPPMQLPFTSNQSFSSPREKANAILDQCQLFCMQFVFLRPITSVVTVVADSFNENRWELSMPQFYMMLMTNVSIFFAFTGLVRFYYAMKDELMWCNPFNKFLCIKGIVFMTFWQSVVISFIAHAIFENAEDELNLNPDEKATEWSKEAQSFLICLEMFAFAIAHCFVFPVEEWESGYREKQQRKIKAKFGDSLALRDFVKDVKTVMKSRKTSSSSRRRKYNKIDTVVGAATAANAGTNRSSERQRQRHRETHTMEDESSMFISENSQDDRFEIGEIGSESADTDTDTDLGSDEMNLSSDNLQGWSRIEEYINIIDEEEEEEYSTAPTSMTQDLHDVV